MKSDKSFAEHTQTNEAEQNASFDEINTYDFPFLAEGDGDPLAAQKNQKSSHGIFYSLYKTAAILAVIMTIFFSASEFMELLISDMGTGNALLRRIFGTNASDTNRNMFEMIIDQTFADMSAKKGSDIKTPSNETDLPSSSQSRPSAETQAPIETPSPQESETPFYEEPKPEDDSPAVLPENCYPILPMDMSLSDRGKNFIYNDTSLSPDIRELTTKKLKRTVVSSEPTVLVLHTHGTEAFMPEGATYYSDNGEIARSSNTEENMIAVGIEFVRILESKGIPTLHCVIMHDAESYRESYSRAAETIEWYMKKYPSISYVFDLHRDSIMKANGELISAETNIGGKSCAQIMPVIGSGFDGYQDNLSFALKLREKLNDKYPSLSRPVCLRESQYNQSLAPVSILLEIGTSGNTLSEAKLAAALTAEAVAEMIILQSNG